MRWVRVTAALAMLGLLVLPGTVFAKGASEAMLSGPGLDTPIRFGGDREHGTDGSLATKLGELSGILDAMWAPGGGSLSAERPSGELGPRFQLTYVVPGPDGDEDELTQTIYPYAKGGPVTYTEPGQGFFETERTRGGWFQAPAELKSMLVEHGLPRDAVAASGPQTAPATEGNGPAWILVAMTLAVLAGVAAVGLRRRVARPAS